jgi:biopolymer transport protein ExbB
MNWFDWWGQADWVIRGVFLLLALMSLATWSVVFYKIAQYRRAQQGEDALAARLAGGAADVPPPPWLDAGPDDAALLRERALLDLRERRLELESGLTWLATIGNSAPFIGLLGTVWGIMHALQGLRGVATLSMDVVAGPVAEALVATAAGLFAAIPAVMAYNLLVRRLRRLSARMDGNQSRLLERHLAERRGSRA